MRVLLCMVVSLGVAALVHADAYYPDQIEAALREEAGTQTSTVVIPAEELPPPPAAETGPAEPVELPTRVIYGTPVVTTPAELDTSVEWTDEVPALEMTDERVHTLGAQPPAETAAVWRVMASGLGRGFANVTLGVGELVRGFTYEYTARPWYYAIGTSWLAAFGGTLSRLGAGLADIATVGYFGDTQLAKGYPDYVWQGDWTGTREVTPDEAVTEEEEARLAAAASLQAARDEQDVRVAQPAVNAPVAAESVTLIEDTPVDENTTEEVPMPAALMDTPMDETAIDE